jgi:6-phosphofructokinase
MSISITLDRLGVTSMPRVFIQDFGNISVSNSFSQTVTSSGGTTFTSSGGATVMSNGGTGAAVINQNANGLTALRASGGDSTIMISLDRFKSGSDAVVTGLSLSDFTLQTTDRLGPSGPTLHVEALPNPGTLGAPTTVDLLGYTTTDLASGRLTARFDPDPLTGASSLHIHANT